ncbi:tubulin polymerization-promoting protein homolog [Sabethes cyaneus]|uniref:tubulin polymerization-promoting protein homolog n=1 Tax=Sabethes cyaneus TaxID=53552 RepID=UPI00237D5BF6|nr:tubulin polymerization-promoting protein homolog [Sabethes cyaneus]
MDKLPKTVAPELPSLEAMFSSFAKYRPALNSFQGDGQRILLSQSDAWMQQALLLGKERPFTLTETGVLFFSFSKSSLDFDEFQQFLEKLCDSKNIDVEKVKLSLVSCGPPGIVS